jgi:hypothetical protein
VNSNYHPWHLLGTKEGSLNNFLFFTFNNLDSSAKA